MAVEYDAWADIYEVWVESAPVTRENLGFYLEEYTRVPGPVVELGVGNGRIAVETAKRGKAITGVDSSTNMLSLCRERARSAGVEHLLTLIQADFREFTLPEPAELIAIPFHTFGHLLTSEDQRAGLRRIHSQLAHGGRLVFDHFIFDRELARRHTGTVRLRTEYVHPKTGRDALLWVCNEYDFEAQVIRVIAWTDEIDGDGMLQRRQYRRLSLSWSHPEQIRAMLEECGLTVEAVYGAFDRTPLGPDSARQIWIARRA